MITHLLKSFRLMPVLLPAILLTGQTGCAPNKPAPETTGLLPVNSFQQKWAARLDLKKDTIRGVYPLGTHVYAVTEHNTVFLITQSVGAIVQRHDVRDGGTPILPPILVGDRVVYPTTSSLEIFDKFGRRETPVEIGQAISGPGAVMDNSVLIGLDYQQGGRLGSLNLDAKFSKLVWTVLTRGRVVAAPAAMQNVIYVASDTGYVYAMNSAKEPIWNGLPQGAFRTDGLIKAGLKVDDYGVYVASIDTKLYCLERATGKLRWQFLAGTPLETPPLLTPTSAYQYIPGVGLASIDKTAGEPNRVARWTNIEGTDPLTEDAKFVYAKSKDGQLIAIDRATGKTAFRSERTDLTLFAAVPESPVIYAATRKGTVLAITPVLTPGNVGTFTYGDAPASPIALAQ